MRHPILLIHGGAGPGRAGRDRTEKRRRSIADILSEVYPRLRKGMSAVDAAVEAVGRLEDDPLFNAGLGSKVQSDGHIRMSAALMDGSRRRFSGCVNVEGIRNPIRLAKSLQSSRDRVLSEKGAQEFARRYGLEFRSPMTAERKRQFKARKSGKTGTVGAVVLDQHGRLAAATSTGGKGLEFPHRVSDSPTAAGCFANRFAAISATGIGEQIVEFSVASAIATLVENGKPLSSASNRLLRDAKRQRAEFGFIGLDRGGGYVAAKTTRSMIWGRIIDEEILLGF